MGTVRGDATPAPVHHRLYGDPNAPGESVFTPEARAGHVLNNARQEIPTSGAMLLTAFVPLAADAAAPQAEKAAPPSAEIRTPRTSARIAASPDRLAPSPFREAPFPTGVGMGIVGLGVVITYGMVRRYRLNIV